jgi:pyruvyltransferase
MPFRNAGPIQYWRPSWREIVRHRFLRNPGDELGPQLVAALLARHAVGLASWRKLGKRLFTIGSIAQLARAGDVVWGAGLRSAALAEHLHPDVDLRAVRGPLTAEAIRIKHGIECRVYGDPGLLAPHLLGLPRRRSQPSARIPRMLFLSHFADPRTPPRHFEHVRMIGGPRRVLDAIGRADIVLSSALHGIVLAEACGVASVWMTGLSREPEFKFLDYYLGTHRPKPRSVSGFRGWESAVGAPPVFNEEALLDAFPLDCFEVEARTSPMQPVQPAL